MIDADVRSAIYQMHLAGASVADIRRHFRVSRNSVRKIIGQQGAMPCKVRSDKIHIDAELLRRLYKECDGWMQRMHEKLVEEEKVQISYPTLTRLVRELGLGQPESTRCDHVPDQPGAEMQHDTSVYPVKLGEQPVRVIASLLYLRYSKRRYLKFYRVFNRFAMKCFLHEALMYWSYAAVLCIIDNTSLARLRGSGKHAVIVPEMVCFAERYGVSFRCHEIRHSNRKAGEERSFWTVETNFLPGRQFESLEDLNRQAYEWSTVRMEHRPVKKTGLIPAKAFEHERHYLIELSPHLPAPYCEHERGTDKYGYVSLEGNYYWVPGSKCEDMKVLQYADRVKLYHHRVCVAEYPLPPDGVKNARFSPEGQPTPRYQPRHRKPDSQLEEKRLRAMGPEVAAYVDYVLATLGVQRHRFLRELLALSQQVTPAVLTQAVQRALKYRVADLPTVKRIAWLYLSEGEYPLEVEVDESYRQRPVYLEGEWTDEPDLSCYDQTGDDQDNPQEPDREPHNG